MGMARRVFTSLANYTLWGASLAKRLVADVLERFADQLSHQCNS